MKNHHLREGKLPQWGFPSLIDSETDRNVSESAVRLYERLEECIVAHSVCSMGIILQCELSNVKILHVQHPVLQASDGRKLTKRLILCLKNLLPVQSFLTIVPFALYM